MAVDRRKDSHTHRRKSVEDIWGVRTPYFERWPARTDHRLSSEPDRWVQSCCLLCSTGCAVDIGVKNGQIVGVRGRAKDRVNRGRLGPKGLHGWEANRSSARLTRPLIRDGASFREATWDEAMDLVVEKVKTIRDECTSSAIAFYSSGQLLLEEYHTLSVIAHGGLGTDHIDANTRLCTATAEQALCETFGSDGPPGSYADFDVTDCLLLVGHNMAETETVLWSRILDRRRGPRPPGLVVVDPRLTPTAAEADVHLAPRPGTNVALLNGLLHLLVKEGHLDMDFVDRRTAGFDRLAEIVAAYTPDRVAQITGIDPAKLREAGALVGNAPTLVSTALQGVYQSHQATAAACQINNINLVRGMIGKPGCTVFQMNGQPTSQNTRETGCNGELPGFRNHANDDHVRDVARRWNVDPAVLPVWTEHAHAMEIFRHAETGSVKLLWVVATNPAVSMPELSRIRDTLRQQSIFLVVQDAFLTETARLADVVLPAAIWAEKTGCATNADRTVHLTLKAVDPPGEARSDLDIFLDFAARMDFRDKDGAPLVKWEDAEGAFEHWKECSRGWPCDYSGLSYAKLRGGSGIQWPCTEDRPHGTERLYTDHVFATGADRCRTYGHDLETGAPISKERYRADDPRGRAILKAADYQPPPEEPDAEFPFRLTTGRVVHQLHTRTKTGRCEQLRKAAPEGFVQISEADAERLGIRARQLLEVASRRGTLRAPARIGGIAPGHVFVPFHYGYWDEWNGEHQRAANELTRTDWDPVSKQPTLKHAAVSVRPVAVEPHPHPEPEAAQKIPGQNQSDERSHVADYLDRLDEFHGEFARACRELHERHADEPDVHRGLRVLAETVEAAERALKPHVPDRIVRAREGARSLRAAVLPGAHRGAYGLLRDLHALLVLAAEGEAALMIVMQAAKALRDGPLTKVCDNLQRQGRRRRAWIADQLKHRASQSIVVPQ